MAKILKGVWQKIKIGERSVGIVIPEFSTFTKLLNLPKINISELDEAVRWQAQDFLPENPINMVMDWKIVKTEEKNYQVLAIATNKDNLEGYISSCEKAGLFPLMVETPSLALARIAVSQSMGRVIIYKYWDEGVTVIADGEKILGSSVIIANDTSEILSTAKRIINHYKQVKVEKILIGGENIEESIPKLLGNELKIPVEIISPDIKGVKSQQELQKYLIPISLQTKEPTEPSDEYSINLLPSELVKKYTLAKRRVQSWSLTLTITLFVWTSFLVSVGIYILFIQQISSLKQERENPTSVAKQRQQLVDKVKEINTIATNILKIKDAQVSAQVVINQILALKPIGVVITDYKLDLDKGVLNLKGTALTRQDIVDLNQSLSTSNDFASINIPISSFEAENNINFGLSMNYVPVTSRLEKKDSKK